MEDRGVGGTGKRDVKGGEAVRVGRVAGGSWNGKTLKFIDKITENSCYTKSDI